MLPGIWAACSDKASPEHEFYTQMKKTKMMKKGKKGERSLKVLKKRVFFGKSQVCPSWRRKKASWTDGRKAETTEMNLRVCSSSLPLFSRLFFFFLPPRASCLLRSGFRSQFRRRLRLLGHHPQKEKGKRKGEEFSAFEECGIRKWWSMRPSERSNVKKRGWHSRLGVKSSRNNNLLEKG